MRVWTVLILAVGTLLLCACGTVIPEAAEMPDPPAVAESPASAAAEDDLTPLLSEIRERMHPGTAGSSLTAEQLAVQVLDWCMQTEMDASQIAAVTERFCGGWDENTRKEYALQLLSVCGAVERLRGENSEALLGDIGGTEGTLWPWTDAPVEKIAAIFSAAQMEALTSDLDL